MEYNILTTTTTNSKKMTRKRLYKYDPTAPSPAGRGRAARSVPRGTILRGKDDKLWRSTLDKSKRVTWKRYYGPLDTHHPREENRQNLEETVDHRMLERMSLVYGDRVFDQRMYREYGDRLDDLIAHRPDLQTQLWEWMMPPSDFDPRLRPAELLDYTVLTKRLLAFANMNNIPLLTR